MGRFRKSSHTRAEHWDGKHRFEHWYRDNSIYFITSKVRDGAHHFASDDAKAIFWDRFDHYTREAGFVPWVTTLLSNHYHTIAYLERGENLGPMMRKLHGSVAWMVCKALDTRYKPFWRERGARDYFDGCIRDALQAERAYRYTLKQAVKARLVRDWREYPHTRVNVDMERAIRRAGELNAYMEDVPYARYEKKRRAQLS